MCHTEARPVQQLCSSLWKHLKCTLCVTWAAFPVAGQAQDERLQSDDALAYVYDFFATGGLVSFHFCLLLVLCKKPTDDHAHANFLKVFL